MPPLRLYNTRTRRLEAFCPLIPGTARVYSCGPTVYARQHAGNLRTYIFADLLTRTLRAFGYAVRHVINITDVGHLTDDADAGDDKVERAARSGRGNARQIAEHWTRVFQQDLARLGVRDPDVWCRASEHVSEQIAMIQTLERRGFTYRLDDGLYFDTSRDPDYGAFGRLSADRNRTRVAAGSAKRNPADFALWKFSPTDGPRRQLEWPSPWGVGFPGWHIECSAMATKYLGDRFDIHTGGIDHVPVHHTNEIAQSEAARGVHPWVTTWMHGGWLKLDGTKISKSSGPVPMLDDLEAAGFEPAVFRYFVLTAHYRKPLDLTLAGLGAARRALGGLRQIATAVSGDPDGATEREADRARDAFYASLGNDLNAPAAIGVLWEIARESELGTLSRARLVRELGGVLGLDLAARRSSTSTDRSDLERPTAASARAEIERLVLERTRARSARDWAAADALRTQLRALGVELEDGSDHTRWSWIESTADDAADE